MVTRTKYKKEGNWFQCDCICEDGYCFTFWFRCDTAPCPVPNDVSDRECLSRTATAAVPVGVQRWLWRFRSE